MKILAINSGSSSIKYRLFDQNFQVLKQGTIKSWDELALNNVDAVGHRVVHGGEEFKGPALITKEVIKSLKKLAKLAPLHSELNLAGIEAMRKLFPGIPQVAVFDTSLNTTMEPKAFLYGIPIKYYERYDVRKYGFHGINHSYMAEECARQLKRPQEELKIITCHLGSGCSINAFDHGKSIDNSMGFTPLEGLVMRTRCGDIDPSVIFYLIENLKLNSEEVKDLLNKKSGLLGLSGKSDMREIIADAKRGDRFAEIAIDVFVYRIQKYIGAFAAALNGVDAIVFSGGIGENSPEIRDLILKNFSYLGARVDPKKNETNTTVFSSGGLPLIVIPANEELVIAKQTYEVISAFI